MIEFELVGTIERYPCDLVIEYAKRAEDAGFDAVGVPDHFHPWSHKYGQGGFCWVVVSVLVEKLKRLQVGSCVTTPLLRYHPAVIAQAWATLGYLYPGRIYLGVGTGEAMNEVPLGYEFPPPRTRIEMLDEALHIIKMLWEKDRVSYKGKYWALNKATLYTKPRAKIPLFVAGTGVRTARVAGKYADAFITVPHIKVDLQKLKTAIRQAARKAGRSPDRIEYVLHLFVSYNKDYKKAVESIRPWAATVIPALYRYGVYDPVELDENAEVVGDEILAEKCLVATTPEDIIKYLEQYINKGFTRFQFNNTSPEPKDFIDIMGEKVIPYIRETYG